MRCFERTHSVEKVSIFTAKRLTYISRTTDDILGTSTTLVDPRERSSPFASSCFCCTKWEKFRLNRRRPETAVAPRINHKRWIPTSSCHCFATVLGGQAVQVGLTCPASLYVSRRAGTKEVAQIRTCDELRILAPDYSWSRENHRQHVPSHNRNGVFQRLSVAPSPPRLVSEHELFRVRQFSQTSGQPFAKLIVFGRCRIGLSWAR